MNTDGSDTTRKTSTLAGDDFHGDARGSGRCHRLPGLNVVPPDAGSIADVAAMGGGPSVSEADLPCLLAIKRGGEER